MFEPGRHFVQTAQQLGLWKKRGTTYEFRRQSWLTGRTWNQDLFAFHMRRGAAGLPIAPVSRTGVDQSKLSLVLRGLDSFTYPELDVFCALLEVTPAEWWLLHCAVVGDREYRGLARSVLADAHFIQAGLATARVLMFAGAYKEAMRQAHHHEREARRLIRSTSSEPALRFLRRLRGDLVLTKTEAFSYFGEAAGVLRLTKAWHRRVARLAGSSDDRELAARNDSRLAAAYYVNRDSVTAANLLRPALIDMREPDYRINSQRNLTLALAYIDDDSEVAALRAALEADCEASAEMAELGWEGLGRAECLTGTDGLITLRERADKLPPGQLALALLYARATAVGAVALVRKYGDDPQYRLDPAHRDHLEKYCLPLAKQLGNVRYASEIEGSLNELP